MNVEAFRSQIGRYAADAGVTVPDSVAAGLYAYYDLLRRWNARINLTALPLAPPTADTFARLFIEPLVAAAHLPNSSLSWFDLGSGGGSPAIPIKLAHPKLRLTMVESKMRKAAFLREAVRQLNLADVRIENVRFADLLSIAALAESIDVITARAVRIDADFLAVCTYLLASTGELILIGYRGKPLRGYCATTRPGVFRRVCST